MRKIEDVILKDGRSLKKVLELHKEWIEDSYYGKKADISYENLTDVDFSNSDLRYVILRGTNLSYVDLTDVDLTDAYLKGVNLRGANLEGVCLEGANLKGAYL